MASEAYRDWSGEAAGARLRVNFTLKLLLSQNFYNRPLMRFISFASNIGPAAAVPAGPAPAPLLTCPLALLNCRNSLLESLQSRSRACRNSSFSSLWRALRQALNVDLASLYCLRTGWSLWQGRPALIHCLCASFDLVWTALRCSSQPVSGEVQNTLEELFA